MANDNTVTYVGNMTRDAELRYTPQGVAVVNFGLALNERVKNQDTGEWEDGTPTFIDCVAWGSLGENLSESAQRGTRVILVGRMKLRSWENDDGEKRSKLECVVDAIGPELRWATATVEKVKSGGYTPPVDAYDDAPTGGGGTATKTRAKAKTAPPPAGDYDEEPF